MLLTFPLNRGALLGIGPVISGLTTEYAAYGFTAYLFCALINDMNVCQRKMKNLLFSF
ncbi:unnamed protein product [Rodentolepis nana]|uniref:Preprotein translocase subunit SecY n=1 Tax=Rodentolepis nana TaxID=102285 RepID=A0A0R3T7X8_RODNA|nr:unnamed protein product [Rodentolepis nana]